MYNQCRHHYGDAHSGGPGIVGVEAVEGTLDWNILDNCLQAFEVVDNIPAVDMGTPRMAVVVVPMGTQVADKFRTLIIQIRKLK